MAFMLTPDLKEASRTLKGVVMWLSTPDVVVRVRRSRYSQTGRISFASRIVVRATTLGKSAAGCGERAQEPD
jgi:hypothetical protein